MSLPWRPTGFSAETRWPPANTTRASTAPVDARVVFAGGQRVSALKPVGRHGSDIRYRATVTSTSDLRVGAKYTVRIRLAGSPAVSRLVKLHAPKGY